MSPQSLRVALSAAILVPAVAAFTPGAADCMTLLGAAENRECTNVDGACHADPYHPRDVGDTDDSACFEMEPSSNAAAVRPVIVNSRSVPFQHTLPPDVRSATDGCLTCEVAERSYVAAMTPRSVSLNASEEPEAATQSAQEKVSPQPSAQTSEPPPSDPTPTVSASSPAPSPEAPTASDSPPPSPRDDHGPSDPPTPTPTPSPMHPAGQEPARSPVPSVTGTDTASVPSAAPVPSAPPAPVTPPGGGATGPPDDAAALRDPLVDPASGRRPGPAPGLSVSMLDGVRTASDVAAVDDDVRVRAGSLELNVAALGSDGAAHRPASGATLVVDRGGNMRLRATGYIAGSEVVAWIFSDAVRLGKAVVEPDGTIDVVFPVPTAVPGGRHTLQVNGRSADGVASVSLGVLVDGSGLTLWQGVDHPEAVLGTQVALFALVGLGVLSGVTTRGAGVGVAEARKGAAARRPLRSAARRREDEDREKGEIAQTELEHVGAVPRQEAGGDRSRSWRVFPSYRLDQWSMRWPLRIAPFSPLTARLMTDGGYLRAMLGGLAPSVTVVAVAAGAVAANGAGALGAPTAALTALVLVLGVLDALAGMAAGVTFLCVLLASGHLDSGDALRGSLGVAALWFALPLIAGAIRPLRREAARSPDAAWYRLGDALVLPLLTGWVTFELVSAFPGLYGHVVPISGYGRELGLVAGAAVLARLVLEEVATRLYPRRLSQVCPDPFPPAPKIQRATAVAVRTALFVFVAEPFVGLRAELFIATAMFAAPQLLAVWDDRLPDSALLCRILPRGLVKLTALVAIGWWLSQRLSSQVHDPRELIAAAFLVLALPPFLEGVLALLGRQAPEPPETWWRRAAGAVVVVTTTLVLYALAV